MVGKHSDSRVLQEGGEGSLQGEANGEIVNLIDL